MANYEYEHSIETTASADAVWALWSDVSRWTEWDTGLTAIELTGPFEVGSTGTMTMPGRPPIDFRLTEVVPGTAFTDETVLPGAVLRFGHTATPLPDGRLRVTHRVEIDGPDAARLGPAVTSDLPEAVRTLTGLAEASSRV